MTSAEENDELEVLEVAEEQEATVVEEVETGAEVKELAEEVQEEKKAEKTKKTKHAKRAKKGKLMSTAVRKSLTAWADQNEPNDKKATRLQALLLVDEGMTQSAAAAATNLSVSQVTYAVGQFREKGVSLFIPPAANAPAAELEINTAVEVEAEAVAVEELDETVPQVADETTMVSISPKQFRAMMAELNKFADRIQQQVKFTPPPFSADEMLNLMQKLTPERLTIINDMQNLLDNRPDAKELFDADTWRGMWFILTYTAQNESKSLFSKAKQTVTRLPGVSLGMRTGMAIFNKLPGSSLVLDVLGMLEGASPKDLLDPETWRGMIYLINYSLQYELEQMKERFLGGDTAVAEEEEEWEISDD